MHEFKSKIVNSCHNLSGNLKQDEKALIEELPRRSLRTGISLTAAISLLLIISGSYRIAAAFSTGALLSVISLYSLVTVVPTLMRSNRKKLFTLFMLLKIPIFLIIIFALLHVIGEASAVVFALLCGVVLMPAIMTMKTLGRVLINSRLGQS